MRDVAFVYGAIETPWPGMGRYLSEHGGVVADVIERGEAFIRKRLGLSLHAAMASDEPIPEALLSPINTVAQIALSAAWQERGLEPSALICRCGGEFAAAHVSGAIGFEDALEAPCRIASLIASGKGRGQIIVVRLSCEDARALSAECPVRCEMISEGDANSAVVGCSQEHAAAAIAFFTSKNIVATTTRLLFAAHTWLVEETSTALLYPLARPARPARLPIYSATARGLLPPIQDWARHFRRVVRDDLSIRAVIGAALDDGVTRFVEVGGWPSLRGFIESEAAARGLCLSSLATMERERPLRATMDETLEALGAPFVPA